MANVQRRNGLFLHHELDELVVCIMVSMSLFRGDVL